MRNVLSASEFNRMFGDRLARLRVEKGLTQNEMGQAIGILGDTYKKYENRSGSGMPLYLIPLFAEVVGCSIEYLFTGRSDGHVQRAQRRGPRPIESRDAQA